MNLFNKKPKYKNAMVELLWKCSLDNCPYCITHYENWQHVKNDTVHTKDEWLNALTRLDPSIIDFVGGEPFLYPDFIDMLCDIDHAGKHKVAITTNLHHSGIDEFIERVNPNNVVAVNCSFHSSGTMTPNEFMAEVIQLSDARFNVTVNVVQHPSNYQNLPQLFRICKCTHTPIALSPLEDINQINNQLTFSCDCGTTSIVINSNGDIYPCLTAMSNGKPHGNIFTHGDVYEPVESCTLPCASYYILNALHDSKNINNNNVKVLR